MHDRSIISFIAAHGTRLSNSEWLTVIESHCYLIKAILFDESSPIYFPSVGTYCTVRTSGTLRIVRIGATFLDNNVNPSLLSPLSQHCFQKKEAVNVRK